MDRQTTYTQALGRSTDFLQAQQNIMAALGWNTQSTLGTATAVDGFACTPSSPAALSVLLTAGAVYQVENLEATSWSMLTANTSVSIMKQGLMQTTDVITLTPPSTTGYAQNFLIEVQYSDLDTTPALLPYYNTSNPTQPYQGPGNSGVSQSTQRLGIAAVQVKAGTAATSGTQATPTPDAGWVGLYVVTLAAGQTTITSGNIVPYTGAPFIPAKLPGIPSAVQSGQWVYGVASGTSIYTATLFSTAAYPYARAVGMEILVYFANANTTTTPTLTENGQAAAQIRKQGAGAPAAGDIVGFVPMIWDGTYWRINGLVASDVLAIIAAVGRPQAFNLAGGAAPGSKTASWTADRVTAASALGGTYYGGASLSLNFNGAGTGANGMDTGAMPTSADLSVYAIFNPTTNTWATLGCAGSTSRGAVYTGTNLPSGYTASALIWSGVTTSGGAFQSWNQIDRKVWIAWVTINSGLNSSSIASMGSLSPAVPANAKTWMPVAIMTNNTASNIYFFPTASGYASSGGSAIWGSNYVEAGADEVPFYAAQTAYYEVTNSGAWIGKCKGYTF